MTIRMQKFLKEVAPLVQERVNTLNLSREGSIAFANILGEMYAKGNLLPSAKETCNVALRLAINYCIEVNKVSPFISDYPISVAG